MRPDGLFLGYLMRYPIPIDEGTESAAFGVVAPAATSCPSGLTPR
jgi:hypothetical protein